MSEKTLTSTIHEKINEVDQMKDQLDPVKCAELLVELSVLYASLNKHIAERQDAFYKFHKWAMDENLEMSAAKLNIIVRAGDEAKRMNESLRLEKSLIEIIRSLKRYANAKTNEWETSKNL